MSFFWKLQIEKSRMRKSIHIASSTTILIWNKQNSILPLSPPRLRFLVLLPLLVLFYQSLVTRTIVPSSCGRGGGIGVVVHAWQQWDYTNYATDDWRDIWGYKDGPRGRRGHTLLLYERHNIIMFGGRDNEIHKPDVPKTYSLINDEGILKFDTYDEKPVRAGYDPSSCQPVKECVTLDKNATSSGKDQSCSYSWDHVLTEDMTATQRQLKQEQCGFTTSGVFYNDIWVYDLSCSRYDDLPCVDDGWKVLHPGNLFGGCQGRDSCDIPFARWGHGAVMYGDDAMLIYGGFSQECEDYCEDIWLFNFTTVRWKEIKIHTGPNPGRRWKFSMVGYHSNHHGHDDNGEQDEEDSNIVAILFGGHRLWHGFSNDNSEDNLWSSTEIYEQGGYLNDLWILHTVEIENDQNVNGIEFVWTQQTAKESCRLSPGLTWKERNDVRCNIYWPKERSGHAAVFDEERNGLWIHGGFTSHYPYPSSSSPGSAEGVMGQRKKGFIPFASHSYYLDDLWFYNITSGYWKQMKQRTLNHPVKRMDHMLLFTGDMLILHGGYSENHYFNDTWYYYIDENRWLKRTTYVHAYFPDECVDDMEYVKQESDCIELKYPPPLKRSNISTFTLGYQQLLPFQQQPGYTPDSENPLYFGIVYDAEDFVAGLRRKFLENEVYDYDGNRIWIRPEIPDGTPIAPNAATGPRQYAQKKRIQYNDTSILEIWEWCTSVEGEPTRDRIVDGAFGRSNSSISIPQLRRQGAGWDGCRELRWKHPPSRTDHKGIFVKDYSLIFLYGGLSYKYVNITDGEHPSTPSLNVTYETSVKSDLWIFGVHSCPNNCSDHGSCRNGFCLCDPGYYGLDCSNITCPGSVCYYDENNLQHCTHCCYDGYVHTDEKLEYEAEIRKISCQHKSSMPVGGFTGYSNGICDGFGSCQCAPPFLGEDCSIRDCKNDCSFNGYCSLEFPNSRCICDDGYYGDHCQFIECLNNCSYPNGVCDQSSGLCSCGELLDPYNKRKVWSYWQGEDCSYLTPWCGAYCKRNYVILLVSSTLFLILWTFI